MSFSWIDPYVDGVIENYDSNDVYQIYKGLGIHLIRVDRNDSILKGNDAMYIRSFYGMEVVYLRDDLPLQYEKFVLCHELGHAILHTEIPSAAYNNKLVVKGKLEKQADYFAIKLFGIRLDDVSYEGLTTEQIATDLCVTEESLNYV